MDEGNDETRRRTSFAQQVGAKALRKLHASKGAQGVWAGLGTMGMVGWSVVVWTLLGAALGMWLDEAHPGKHPWTLALLVAGLCLGCLNAWHWIAKEHRAIQKEQGEPK